jgi:hypothetical protein
MVSKIIKDRKMYFSTSNFSLFIEQKKEKTNLIKTFFMIIFYSIVF